MFLMDYFSQFAGADGVQRALICFVLFVILVCAAKPPQYRWLPPLRWRRTIAAFAGLGLAVATIWSPLWHLWSMSATIAPWWVTLMDGRGDLAGLR
jgi:hypothetical protein